MPSTRSDDDDTRPEDDAKKDAGEAEVPPARRRIPERGLSRDQLRALTDEIHQRKQELQSRRRATR